MNTGIIISSCVDGTGTCTVVWIVALLLLVKKLTNNIPYKEEEKIIRIFFNSILLSE
jgi:hypothetical protein